MILLDPLARPVIAHRGASGEYPENTLLAFARGLEQGADGIECDVRLAADGTPVVIHDATLDRTTSGRGPVAAFTVEQLRQVDAGRGERIPTLADVLDAFPHIPVILEIKEPRAAVTVRRVLADHHAAGRVLVGAFERESLRPFEAGGWRSASRSETALFWAAARTRYPLYRPGFHAFTVPARYGWLPVVTAAFVDRARRLEQPVHVWTVDTPEEAAALRALGVAGIISNYPGRLVRTSPPEP